jgi:uncharacterized protein YceH (UPF0502 family)
MKKYSLVTVTVGALMLAACQTDSRDQVLATSESQVQMRSIQSRAFDTTDKHNLLRTTIATLQDLGFVIDKADAELGTISGTKLDGYALRMTVSIRERDKKQLLVRANAQYNVVAVDDPEPYQQFFAALEKAMFLTAHQIDG